MGLAGPRNKRKLAEDPNNTRWSRNETTFGQRIMRQQGWAPGQVLGAQDAAHAAYHTAASSAPIKVALKDDTLGLGAKVRQKQSNECTGLDVFKDLLGRLNGKSEEVIEKERSVRSGIKTNMYIEQKYGLMRFVSGGLLVGDSIQELIKTEDAKVKAEPEVEEKKDVEMVSETEEKSSSKKDKKSKKRKADDTASDEPVEKSRDKKKRRKASGDSEEDQSAEESSKKKKKSKKAKDESESDDDSAKAKKKKEKKEKKARKAELEAAAAVEDDEDAEKRRKREKKEKKRRKQEAEQSASASGTATPTVTETPVLSGTATPSASGTSTPQMSARHYARSRNIASKRQAMADMKSLNQIFMVKPV